MVKSLALSLLLLPGTVTVFIPFALLYISFVSFGNTVMFTDNLLVLILSMILLYGGLFLMGMTTLLFVRIGGGTPAPWDPPKHLVVRGPYRYVRNPMIIGVLVVLLGEALLFWSLVLVLWMVLFFCANLVYFPLVEEKRLRTRFGAEYEEYMRHVPRWIPRLTPWDKEGN
jgi:protein-S-isoprenylcysteine O-methyltransferase Ste14